MAQVTELMRALGLEYPVIQAPMAAPMSAPITTPDLVAAVSSAGGLGSLGAAYMSPEAIRGAVVRVRELTDKPFAVNLFVPTPFEDDPQQIESSGRLLEPYRRELGLEPTPSGPQPPYAEAFDEQLAVIIEERVPVFSSTFGSLPATEAERLKENGTKVVGTATTVEEGERLQAEGVDAVVAQGAEAGGHRGTFLGDFGSSMVGTMALVPQMVDALAVPVVASGGIMDGRGIAAALCLGAQAAQMGTAFLACEESGAHPSYKAAVLEATEDGTAITRAFSGRPARGIKNRLLLELAEHEEQIAPYPLQNALTQGIRAAARKQDRPEFMSLWAGQAARLARSTTAAEIVTSVAEEADLTLRRLAQPSRRDGATA
ncbi:MAG: nitronate monooxygenase [Actinomycetota bacterium]|nr:nitronate monooxygenase [Actinomycetota bacterium]